MRSQTNSLRRADLERDSRRRHDHPGKALVAAVLDGAREDLKRGRHLADPAREWFQERDPRRAWSFEWCCDVLDLDPDAVRQEISGDRKLAHIPRR